MTANRVPIQVRVDPGSVNMIDHHAKQLGLTRSKMARLMLAYASRHMGEVAQMWDASRILRLDERRD